MAYERIYAPLRNEQATSLAGLNNAIRQQLVKHHQKPFQRKAGGNRLALFQDHERPLLSALPASTFEVKYCVKAKVQRNYHIVIGQDWHYYSVPYEYIDKRVQVVYTSREVEVYYQNKRIALHQRSRLRYSYTTLAVPHAARPPALPGATRLDSRVLPGQSPPNWACCLAPIEQILSTKLFIEQTYNSCLGLLRLVNKYSAARLEAACCRALRGHRINYTIIHNILKNNLDKLEQPAEVLSPIPEHGNIRGTEAYQ
ncbi:MAG: hypothetical protein H6566_23580 [Lewinellaceae bacterium]|nr:hypothetical protein [Lewinellaceae bacterium]